MESQTRASRRNNEEEDDRHEDENNKYHCLDGPAPYLKPICLHSGYLDNEDPEKILEYNQREVDKTLLDIIITSNFYLMVGAMALIFVLTEGHPLYLFIPLLLEDLYRIGFNYYFCKKFTGYFAYFHLANSMREALIFLLDSLRNFMGTSGLLSLRFSLPLKFSSSCMNLNSTSSLCY